MILDKITNAASYFEISTNLKAGFEYILKTDLTNLPVGRHEILPNEVFALVSEYETKLPENCKPEAHRVYGDIQFMVAGKELIGYVPLNGQKESIPYSEEKDIAFFEAETNQLVLSEGMFAVFFPQDIHRPSMMADFQEKIKKVVVKFRL